MALARLLLENLITSSIAGATLTGGTWALPLANLKDTRIRSNPARCTDIATLASSQLRIQFDRPVHLTTIFLCGHTLGLDALRKVTAGTTGLAEVVALLDWTDVYPPIYSTDELGPEDPNWLTGKPLDRDLGTYQKHHAIRFPEAIVAEEVLIEIDDRDNPAGFFDIGYLFASHDFQPAKTIRYEPEIGLRSNSIIERLQSGRRLVDYVQPSRYHRIEFPALTKREVMRLLDVAARSGEGEPVIFVPDFDDALDQFREVFPAVLTSPFATRLQEDNRYRVTMDLEELQG